MTTYDSELINVATTAQAQKIALTLPESWSALSDISQIVIDMQCPALWRIEAFDAARSTVGQTQLFFDDGFQQLTSVDAEIWDRHMQGVLGFDEQKIQINAYYLNLDAALGLYRWYRHTALKNLIPLSNQRPALKNVTIDFRKVSLGQQDLGKIHLSYALSEQEHESRWTLQHHAIRAQMLEKQEDNHLFSREAVVYADNISQLSPVIPELSGIQKGQVILNYYQNATSPDKHSLYLAANDVFLKQATCRQLKILNVLSGYAFSKEQFEALLSDGWFIDKMGIDALWQNDVLFIKKANVHSGAASFDAYGHYNRRDDLLAIDLKISPKISSALPSLGFIGGPLGSALAFAGVQIFGAQEFDRLNQQKWQLYGSIKAPQIRPWEAEVIDLTAGYDQDNAAIMSHSSEVVVTRLNHVREEMQNNAGPAH
jgi:hypothetical protein